MDLRFRGDDNSLNLMPLRERENDECRDKVTP